MKGFARMTKLSNVGGRAAYISDPKRQEEIVAKSAPVDWEPYRRFEQSNQRTAAKNNEGREVIIALPNSWAKLPEEELARRSQSIAETAIGKSTDLQWAVHWNKSRSNLHLHVVFSERQREANVGRWDRDIYHTADGKVARSKAERARLPDGSIAPPVHRKGDLKGGFTAKDTKYKSKGWLEAMKATVQSHMTERWQVKFDAPALLHEYHEGKGKDAPKIREKNEAIRATNQNVKALTEAHPEMGRGRTYAAVKRESVKGVKQGHVVEFQKEAEQTRVLAYELPTWKLLQKQRQQQAEQPIQTPAPTAPEPPKAPFAELIEAQRELYRQTFALNDTRKPLDTNEIRKAAAIRSAAEDLNAAIRQREAARKRENACGFFQLREKREAKNDYDIATLAAERALEKLQGMGISTRMGGIVPNFAHHTPEDFRELCDRVKDKAADIEYEARKIARPSQALKGSQDAQRAAQERFTELCRQIPPEQYRAARNALTEAQKELEATKGGYPMADAQAKFAITNTRDKLLTERTQQPEKTHTRGGHVR